jgi:adenylate cyclase
MFRSQAGSANIVVVEITDADLAQRGRLATWPRALHADAVRNLAAAGARVIAYDILFADAGADDEAFAAAIRDAGNVVLAAAGGGGSATGEDGLRRYSDVTVPAPALRDAALALGHTNVDTDADGRVRRVPVEVGESGGPAVPSLSVAAFFTQFGRDLPAEVAPGGASPRLFGRLVPLEEGRTLRVNYAGGRTSFAAVPFAAVLTGDVPPEVVKDKIVIVGVRAAGVDRHSLPLLGNAAGLEIHANALDTLLRARFLHVRSERLSLLTGLAFSAAAALFILRSRVGYAVLGVAATGIGYLIFCAWMFQRGQILDAVNPTSALALSTMVGLVYRVFSERAAQQEVIDLFGRYVSKEVAGELVQRADLGDLRMGGELRETSVLFGDIRGFTTLSLDMDPGDLVKLLNARFEVIVNRIGEQGGIVNMFIGDAIMAFWNAPHDQPDHAYLACRAALDAAHDLEAMSQDGPEIRFGFGVNSGITLAGNVGSEGRFEYTLMGETVNTSSRLSGVSGGGEVWIGARTRELLGGRIASEELPPQQLKGMAQPIVPYRLIDGPPEPVAAAGRAMEEAVR